jgi:hypothetical protein
MAERPVHFIVRFTLKYRWASLTTLGLLTLVFSHYAQCADVL